MDVNALIPTPDAIPVHWAWFDVLLHVTFATHLLLMNALVGGAAISLICLLRGREDIPRELCTKLPGMTAFTINLGVAPLLFLQVLYGNFVYVSSVLMAAWWLSVIGLVLVAYYGLYIHDFTFEKWTSGRTFWLALSLALLLCTGFLFTNNMTLMLAPERWSAFFANRTGTLLNIGDPTLWPRWLHFMTGALAVGGLGVAVVGRGKGRRDIVATGLSWFLWGTLCQLVFGTWFLLSLPPAVLALFMGGSAKATAIFVGGLLFMGLALYAAQRRHVGATLLSVLPLMACMVLNRDQVRTAALSAHQTIQGLRVTGEYSPMVFFLACLALALPLAYWMIAQYRRAV